MSPPPHATHAAPQAVTSGRRTLAMARLVDSRFWPTVRAVTALVVLYAASFSALLAGGQAHFAADGRWLALLFPLLVLAIMHARRAAEDRLHASPIDTVLHVLGIVSLATILTIALDTMIGGHHSVSLAARLWLFTLVDLGIARVMLISIQRVARRAGALMTPTLILGAGTVGSQIAQRLEQSPEYGMRVVGFLDSDPMPIATGERRRIPLLGSPDDLAQAARSTGARHVILAFSSAPDHTLVALVGRCRELGLEVSLVPRLFETLNDRTRLDHVGGMPLLGLRSVDPDGWQFTVKHALDRLIALIALIALGPLMLVLTLAVRGSSPGPALFRQRRVGRDRREFDILKFRTMLEPGPERESDDDRFVLPEGVAPGGVEGCDRRNRLGRWLRSTSLDELPQLINVLRGEMSIVGPRPERPQFVALFEREVLHYEDRHRVKSGITGWAQVCGLRGQTSIADRVEWDNFYIQNWSPWFDLRILLLTIAEVLRFRDSGGQRQRPVEANRRELREPVRLSLVSTVANARTLATVTRSDPGAQGVAVLDVTTGCLASAATIAQTRTATSV
ncbi:MAG: exopolysaccharide biosynthesis polyprenyl glycosylphosphotransferase [Solirubrobacteraceae bacterium]